MPRPSFREAIDTLCLSAPEAAELFDRPLQSIRQMRLDPDNRNYRPPPEGWQGVLAKMARKKGGQLARLADELEQGAGQVAS